MEGLKSLDCNFATKVATPVTKYLEAKYLKAAAQANKEIVPQKCISNQALKTFPPGYRFNPTDEELIRFYLKNKVAGKPFPDSKIYDVNLYKYNPEDLREMFNLSEERDWYFFTPRQRKYRNGNRPNRAAGNGYWKATGADKSIPSREMAIGVRKALVFYKGKPPRGEKTSWIMHEYRVTNSIIEKPPPKALLQADDNLKLDDWVLCKIYEKKSDEDRSTRSVQTPTTDTGYNEQMETMEMTNSFDPLTKPDPDPMEFRDDKLCYSTLGYNEQMEMHNTNSFGPYPLKPDPDPMEFKDDKLCYSTVGYNEQMEMHNTNSFGPRPLTKPDSMEFKDEDNLYYSDDSTTNGPNLYYSDETTTNGPLGLMNLCDYDQLFAPHLTVDTVGLFTPDRSFNFPDSILVQPINSVPKNDRKFKPEDDLDEVWSEYLKQDGRPP